MYDSLSPIRYVKKVQTPTLMVQSEEDFRTPMGNADLWFMALQEAGRAGGVRALSALDARAVAHRRAVAARRSARAHSPVVRVLAQGREEPDRTATTASQRSALTPVPVGTPIAWQAIACAPGVAVQGRTQTVRPLSHRSVMDRATRRSACSSRPSTKERRIGPCLAGLHEQGAPLTEIIVIDSGSTDDTRDQVEAMRAIDDRFRLIDDRPLPEGWIGKVWALSVAVPSRAESGCWI